MSTVKFNCPHCQQRLGVDDKFLGKKISCPVCRGHIRLPEIPAPPASAPPAAIPIAIPIAKPQQPLGTTVPISIANGDITFPCTNCGCKLIVTERASGKKIPCRSCGAPVVVPEVVIPPDPMGRETINLSLNAAEQATVREMMARAQAGQNQASQELLALGERGLSELVDGLEASFDEAKENLGADRLVEIIVKLGRPSVKPLITRLGRSRRAYFALGRIGTTEAIEALVRELTSVNWRRVEAACIGLGLVEEPQYMPAIISHLENTRKSTRVGEVYAAAGTAIAALQRRAITTS